MSCKQPWLLLLLFSWAIGMLLAENWFQRSNNITKLLSSISWHANRLEIVLFVLDYSNETLCADDRIFELFSRCCNEDQLIFCFPIDISFTWKFDNKLLKLFCPIVWGSFFSPNILDLHIRKTVGKYFINKYESKRTPIKQMRVHALNRIFLRMVLGATLFFLFEFGKSKPHMKRWLSFAYFDCSNIYHIVDDVTLFSCLYPFFCLWKRWAYGFSCILRLN